MPDHPIQPLVTDDKGVLRFKGNAIVRYLLDRGPFDMNHIAVEDFSQEDREQFAQLIGYSLEGFSELDYVRDVTYETAAKIAESQKTPEESRIEVLQEKLDAVREALRVAVPKLFRIHPDDLIV